MGKAFVGLILLLLAVAQGALGQALSWYTDMPSARQAATAESQQILLFFSAPGTRLNQSFEEHFTRPEIIAEISAHYRIVRMPLAEFRPYAQSMGVFKGGSLVICDSSGQALQVLGRELMPEQFLQSLREVRIGKKTSAPVPTPTPVSTPAATPQPSAVVSAKPEPPRGTRVAGPVTLPTTSLNPVTVGTLEDGKSYVLRIEGLWYPWSQRHRTADALYSFANDEKTGLKVHGNVRFVEGALAFKDYAMKQMGAALEYNPSHVYDLVLKGNGQPLRVYLHENEGRSYTDNTGELTLTLYEAGR